MILRAELPQVTPHHESIRHRLKMFARLPYHLMPAGYKQAFAPQQVQQALGSGMQAKPDVAVTCVT